MKNKSKTRAGILRILEISSTILILAIALNILTISGYDDQQRFLFTGIFALFAFSYSVSLFLKKNTLSASVIFICAIKINVGVINFILSIAIDNPKIMILVTFCFYMITLMAERTIRIFRKMKIENILFNLFCLAVFTKLIMNMTSFVVSTPMDKVDSATFELWLSGVVISIHMLIRVIGMSLKKIRLDLILKIAKRSMALEILSGLMILIIAFSFVLKTMEPQMESLSDALWYCFALVTTIGFGDITATTAIGRLLSVVLGIYGIIVVALITSIIVNFYTELKNEEEEKSKQLSSNEDKNDGNEKTGTE